MAANASNEPWTPVPLIKTTAEYFASKGVPTPKLDAEILLRHVLGLKNRIELYTQFERPLTDAELSAYRELVRRRATREPVNRILGACEFMGLAFTITPAVLSPRPETEILVEQANKRLEANPAARVLDLGTGSGCIAIAIACMNREVAVTAVEVDPAALAVAQKNAEQHEAITERLAFREGDWFAALNDDERFDLILSNPPYIAEGDEAIWPEVKNFDPAGALYAGADGLDAYRRIAAEVTTWLNPGGAVLLEIGQGQENAVTALLQDAGMTSTEVICDHAGIGRVVIATSA